MNKNITIYTDGACRKNPGKGGYGAVLIHANGQKEISAGYELTTNNRMELMAVIAALETLTKKGLYIKIFTDSKYVANPVEYGWLYKWIEKNFTGDIKNKDLWLRYYELAKNHHIKFTWIKGHDVTHYNNYCDKLATSAADGDNLLIDTLYAKT